MAKAIEQHRFDSTDAPLMDKWSCSNIMKQRGLGVVSKERQFKSSATEAKAANANRENLLRGIPILLLIGLSIMGFVKLLFVVLSDLAPDNLSRLDLTAMTGLWLCSLCYLINRYGSAKRRPIKLGGALEIDFLEPNMPSAHISVLIPSYCEEPRVIEMTLLSAALAIYPSRNIVVLIDDPVTDVVSVTRSLDSVEKVKSDLAVPIARMRAEHRAWLQRRQSFTIHKSTEVDRLAENLRYLSDWLENYGRSIATQEQTSFAHVGRFFQSAVLESLANYYQAQISILEKISTVEEIDIAYFKLTSVFCTDISTFQRKQFDNLSHASNKAMNLNAYISLMGGSYRRRSQLKRTYLRKDIGHRPHLVVRKPEFVLTLDADSLIRPQYMHELSTILDKNPTLGVVQTPYLSFPGSKTAVERFAGATTDIQYLIHQGSNFFKASFWVGANALIRFAALKDIETLEQEDGKNVAVFIQDHTVIEDTGSTIDLLAKGWRVENYFSPLAHSATPADFGALCIQRKRWSNGGLLIVGPLLKALITAPSGSFGILSLFLRGYYLLSPIIGNLCLFALILNSNASRNVIFWMAISILPYYVLYGLDLKRFGYRIGDIISISSLNFLLLPVSFAGIAESVIQLVTGRKSNFVRTPKVAGRTCVPVIYLFFYFTLIAYMVNITILGLGFHDYWGIFNPLVNIFLLCYGILLFIGGRSVTHDIFIGIKELTRPRASHGAFGDYHVAGERGPFFRFKK